MAALASEEDVQSPGSETSLQLHASSTRTQRAWRFCAAVQPDRPVLVPPLAQELSR